MFVQPRRPGAYYGMRGEGAKGGGLVTQVFSRFLITREAKGFLTAAPYPPRLPVSLESAARLGGRARPHA